MSLIEHLKTMVTEQRLALFESRIEERTDHITLVLENIYQTHNISAVLRSADCFGIQHVHVIENDNSFEVNKEISLGASKWLDIHRHRGEQENSKTALRKLKKQGYQIIATTPHENDCLIEELDLTKPSALVFGTELTGITDEVREEADGFVKIPMYGFTESFNISVAAALVSYELSKKLRSEDISWQLSESEKERILFNWLKTSIKSSDKIIERFQRENG